MNYSIITVIPVGRSIARGRLNPGALGGGLRCSAKRFFKVVSLARVVG